MRLLVALPYGPTETRVRSRMLLDELARRHRVTLVALAWNEADWTALDAWRSAVERLHIVPHTRGAQVAGLLGAPRPPFQRSISRAPSFARLVRRELVAARAQDDPFDAVHVEHLRGAAALDLGRGLPERTVFDAVDCIAGLARLTRQFGSNRTTRLIARIEEQPTRRLERAFVHAADVTTVVAERDRDELATGARRPVLVVPNGVVLRSTPAVLTDRPVVIFTGKLSYHANLAAIEAFIAEVWPRVRAGVPGARLVIAGSGAPHALAARDGREGIELHHAPQQMAAEIECARVAVAPMRYAVGIQNKVLEAMACGIPVVASSSAAAGLLAAGRTALVAADDPAHTAASVIRMLVDDALARRHGLAGYAYVQQHHSWSNAADRFDLLYGASDLTREAA